MASLRELIRHAARGPVVVHGATPPWVALAAARLAAADPSRPVIVVTADDAVAARLADDLAGFHPGAALLPAPDGSPYAELAADRVVAAARLGVLYRLASGEPPPLIVTSVAALLRRTLDREELLARSLTVRAGQAVDRDQLAARLVAAGFARVPVVEDAGTFAVRGAVVDLATPLLPYPVRLELDGDLVESVRLFDPSTQRTLRTIERVDLHPVRETIVTGDVDWRGALREAADQVHHPSRATRALIEQVAAGDFIGIDVLMPAFHARTAAVWALTPPATTWLWWDPDAALATADAELADAAARHAERVAHRQVSFPPAAHYLDRGELLARLTADPRRVVAPTLELADDPRAAGAAVLRVALDDLRPLRAELERLRAQHDDHLAAPLARAVAAWRADGLTVTFAADSAQRADRLAGLLDGYGLAADRIAELGPGALAAPAGAPLDPGAPVRIAVAPLSASVVSRADGLAVISTADVLGARKAAPRRAAARKARDALLGGVGDFSQLAVGDFLVHQLHGVGRYRGLVKLPGTGPVDFLHLEYDGGTLYLPVYRLGEVQRYVGAEGHAPRLDKLGGVTWEKARTKVSRQVAALAEQLLQLYAQRAALPGHRFPPADDYYREFEAAFAFEETPDQAAAIDAVLADMESPRAMDRLVCGDVGYGKTEVALRAIFRAALAGKQAVLLAPTTLLVEQHARTMTERFASWPISVGRLSRFQSKAEQLATVRALAAGTLDVVVGTHRVLSPDVRFRELGLVVIDEEQRFGVTHKERLKQLRTQVDVLTLTATPIPRTLHLAMAGMRDLSIIATPPADRRAVRTFVATVDETLIKGALEAELARGGQVYFVTRTIGEPARRRPGATAAASRPGEAGIHDWAELVRRLVPRARVGVAHGALPADELEDVMVQFVRGDLDVLVATTIVESGLDIPRANTMFVARADAFGLSQLYQLRGRIGRARERAYCYLLVPPPDQLTDEARRRLEALQRFTELGAGFQIASADLEIRGGGELLGPRQSGSIAAVGFEQYTRMLESAVAELRGQPIHHPIDPELTIEVPGFIPDDYVPDTGQRLDLYKRLSAIEDEDEVREVLDELHDRYGPLPGEVLLLADLMVVKALARRLGAVAIELTRSRLALALAPDAALAAGAPPDPAAPADRLPPPWRRERDGRLHAPIGKDETAPAAAARRRLQSLLERAT
ncbi:MAG: transcription-repair coupling factor [Kofleriaceae bacterium]|nr:transcription-repair coupling factor [Kofleriaceae bacterium]MCL4222934.1 transcription-repair coupling factor [Myxococcales bacterium]